MKKITGLLALILLLCACSSENRSFFSGQSENWELVYTVESFNENSQQQSGVLTFIGKGQAPDNFVYKLTSLTNGSEGNAIDLVNKQTTIAKSSCQGCAGVRENEEIDFSIEWDGQTESFTLTNRNQK